MAAILLYASSRSQGNTASIAQYIVDKAGIPAVDLSARSIAPFSYEDDYPAQDAFIQTIEEALAYDQWIFLTPVYWYSMSGQMKTFFDRFSDVVRYRKDLGEQMKGKEMLAICCGSGAEPIPDFFTPFRLSAEYLKMEYGGDLHTWLGRVPDMKPEVAALLDEWITKQQLTE